ncbi:hypothetical protein BOTBODRAFT_623766 [Botryobasidium botryosum FD-172 SS1]|uniref:Methyltransferase domain-containing protein n=1 Tax=Botryobasidium botryosum (strain FD-172 SS1) TaxID=930990 RepID=A0A067MJ52_BOTB1|nr:hypothetical protein BOTBODRAFT_623766 [Botryobasidium botryosum FD-172 SS1]
MPRATGDSTAGATSDDARTYHSFPGAHYILPADELEKESFILNVWPFTCRLSRLNRQHRLIKRAYDDKLIWAPVNPVPGSAVLDCGTGTGAWLLDLADQVPQGVQFCGIDTESRFFPPSRPDVEFITSSVTALPSEWSSKFQLVHQRLLAVALKASEWPHALLEIKRVLVPEGWAQFEEAGAEPFNWGAGPVTARFHDMMSKLNASRGHIWNVTSHIPGFLADAGFVNVRTEVRGVPLGKWAGKAGCENRDNSIDFIRAVRTPVLKVGGFGYVSTGDEFDHFVAELKDEWDNTPGSKQNFAIFSVQKPAS